MIKTVSVFCSSSNKIDRRYFGEADRLGKILALRDIVCYTGAGSSGLMYEVERSVLDNGGKWAWMSVGMVDCGATPASILYKCKKERKKSGDLLRSWAS